LLASKTTSVVERGRPGIELVYRHTSAMRLLLKQRRLKRRRIVGLQSLERRLLPKQGRLKRQRNVGKRGLERRSRSECCESNELSYEEKGGVNGTMLR
jgi:hypothetical protein